ncbi:MAG: YfbR-like 5'-deoxynucleotidase, partial [Pseudomonadales bacterium]
MNNHFFAYLSKMRWIYRWGMKRNAIQENVMEHSYEVSVITHALGIIGNRFYGKDIDANAAAVAADKCVGGGVAAVVVVVDVVAVAAATGATAVVL